MKAQSIDRCGTSLTRHKLILARDATTLWRDAMLIPLLCRSIGQLHVVMLQNKLSRSEEIQKVTNRRSTNQSQDDVSIHYLIFVITLQKKYYIIDSHKD